MWVLWGASSWHEERIHVNVSLTGEFYNVWKIVIQWHCTPGGLSALFLLPQLMWCVPTPSFSPNQCHTTTISPSLSNPPSTRPTANAYFNVIGLLETTHSVWTRSGLQAFCHFLLAKFLTIFTLKTCFWSHCRTQRLISHSMGEGHCMGTHGYAGQDCTSERYSTARLSTRSAFTAEQQLQAMPRCSWTLPLPAPFKGDVAQGRICKQCQPSPWRGKELLNPSITKPHTRLFNFFPFPPP